MHIDTRQLILMQVFFVIVKVYCSKSVLLKKWVLLKVIKSCPKPFLTIPNSSYSRRYVLIRLTPYHWLGVTYFIDHKEDSSEKRSPNDQTRRRYRTDWRPFFFRRSLVFAPILLFENGDLWKKTKKGLKFLRWFCPSKMVISKIEEYRFWLVWSSIPA